VRKECLDSNGTSVRNLPAWYSTDETLRNFVHLLLEMEYVPVAHWMQPPLLSSSNPLNRRTRTFQIDSSTKCRLLTMPLITELVNAHRYQHHTFNYKPSLTMHFSMMPSTPITVCHKDKCGLFESSKIIILKIPTHMLR